MSGHKQAEERRCAAVENPLFAVGRVLKEMDIVELRIEQAQRRSGLWLLLQPVLETLGLWRHLLGGVQDHLADEWKEGNKRSWK